MIVASGQGAHVLRAFEVCAVGPDGNTAVRAVIPTSVLIGTWLAHSSGMAPSSPRWFSGKLRPSNSVGEMLEALREQAGDGTRRVIVAQLEDSVADARALFRQFDLHHLPVVAGSQIVGIVSATDVLEFFAEHRELDPSKIQLSEIMTPEPDTIGRDASIAEAIRTLAAARFRSLPVTSPTGDIWDIITTRDLIRFLEMSIA